MISDFDILPSLSLSKSLKASRTSESILVESFLELFRTATGLAAALAAPPDITDNCLLFGLSPAGAGFGCPGTWLPLAGDGCLATVLVSTSSSTKLEVDPL